LRTSIREAKFEELLRAEKEQKRGEDLPEEKDDAQREMGEADAGGDELRIESKASLELKEFGAEGIERRIKQFEDCWIVDGGVFDGGMVAVDEKRCDCEPREVEKIFGLQPLTPSKTTDSSERKGELQLAGGFGDNANNLVTGDLGRRV